MSQLELGGNTFTIPVGEVVLGSDAGCAIPLSGAGVLPRHAVLLGQVDGQVIIRKATPAADVLINGVRLGAEPTPLLHGDKVEVGDNELTFVDERRSGSTQFVQALSLPQGPAGGAGVPAVGGGGGGQLRPAAKPATIGTTGGRVVSLTDGREYVITGPSLVFGREAGCDVVVPGKDVSRRHAEIVSTPRGYVVVDSSTNGTFVNEEQVQGQRVLARTDVIRIGDEQFRFYAEAAPLTASSPPPPGVSAASPEQLKHTLHGMEAAAPARPSGAVFASFLVRSGGLMGRRLPVKTPVVNLGRADYNDLVLPDPSVSTSHAKLQRREGVWMLVDLDSTNGTFVEGERVRGEAPLGPGAMVRLGDVQLLFEPADEQQGVLKGGGTQVLRTPLSSAPPAPHAAPAPLPAAPASPASPRSSPPPPSPGSPASPARPGPSARPAGSPPPPRPGTKPAPRRPIGQQPPPKKGKGCGSSAAVLVIGVTGLVVLLYRLLA
jgi:pSer/pThr/pTyr-binding forkhead associated (FHA) protein